MGQGCMKITLIVSCLEWLTCLLLFIMVEFEKLQPRLKMVLIFLVTKVFQIKRVQGSDEFTFNSLMRCYVIQWSCSGNVVASTVCTDTLFQEKKNLHTKLEVM